MATFNGNYGMLCGTFKGLVEYSDIFYVGVLDFILLFYFRSINTMFHNQYNLLNQALLYGDPYQNMIYLMLCLI